MNWFQDLQVYFDSPTRQIGLVLGTTLFTLFLVYLLKRVLLNAAARTKTTVDEVVVRSLYRPVRISILLYGFVKVLEVGRPDEEVPGLVVSSFISIVVIYWVIAFFRVSEDLLSSSAAPMKKGIMTQRSLPFFQMATKTFIVAVGIYFVFIAWDLDLTAWLASAGIIGVAVGFAAKDSLANLFGGVSIMADAPYKLGDFLVLETGERGEVTDIGLRSTRLRTRSDILIVVPNSIMANTKIINESGGVRIPHRIGVRLGVAYGTDVDALKAMVIEECKLVENVESEPAPNILFDEFGDSALLFNVFVTILDSRYRVFVIDEVHTRIYKRLSKEGVVIPFPQREIHSRKG